MFIDLFPEPRPRLDGQWHFGTVSDVEEAPTWTATLVYVGRDPFALDGSRLRALDRVEFNEALAVAFDETAQLVWGEDWSTAVSEISGINRRSTSRDRVRKNGLPPSLMASVIRLAGHNDVREMAPIVRALARYYDAHKEPQERREPGKPTLDLFFVATNAVEILADFRDKERYELLNSKSDWPSST